MRSQLVRITLAVAAASPLGLALGACATDNGPTLHGETFGPLPERRDGGLDGASGKGAGDDAGAPPDGSPGDVDAGTCASAVTAVLAGTDTSLAGAVQEGGPGATWTRTTLSGATTSLPALVATPAGFLGVVRSTSDTLASVSFAGAWSTPSAIGAAQTIGAPSLAAAGATVHLGLHTPAFEHAYGVYTQNAWSAANEPLEPQGGTKAFGPTAPVITAAGADVVAAYVGDDGGLYVQTRSGGAWDAGSAVFGAGPSRNASPVLVPWDGASDLVVLFADNSVDRVVRHAVRASDTKMWSSVANTDALAFTPYDFRVARISSSTLLVAYRGGDDKAYAMIGTYASGAFSWSAPGPIFGGVTVDTAPAIAKGVCGDDAVALVGANGVVKVTRLRAGVWSTAEDVPALATASGVTTRLAVSTRP